MPLVCKYRAIFPPAGSQAADIVSNLSSKQQAGGWPGSGFIRSRAPGQAVNAAGIRAGDGDAINMRLPEIC
jgi:hypothetical protein